MSSAIRVARAVLPWLLMLPALLPLVVSGGLMYPYLVPKTLLFYATGLVSLGAFALLAFSGEAFYFSRLRSRFTWIPGLILAVAYLTSLFGIDFYKSFWSIYARGDGLLMFTISVSSYYLILLSADARFMRRLFVIVAGVGSAVAIYGIGEWLVQGGRIGSLLGNAAFFAGYLALAFLVTLALSEMDHLRSWQTALRIGAALELLAVVLTATRGTLLALMVAGVGALVFVAARGTDAVVRKRSALFLTVLVLLGGTFFAFRAELKSSSFAPLARLASISEQDATVASRLFVWGHMVEEIKKNPWRGVGAEHIDSLFNRFYDPGVIAEEWFDRSHNAYLDYAAQFGVFGLVLYLALIGAFMRLSWRVRADNARLRGTLFLLGAVYAIQNFFVFDTVSSWWLFLALFATLSIADGETVSLPMRAPWFGAALALVCLGLVVPVSVTPLQANHALFESYLYHVSDIDRSVAALESGRLLHTYGQLEYGYELYAMYTGQQAVRLSGAARIHAYEVAKEVLAENKTRYPYDARTALYYAHVISLAPSEVSEPTAVVRAAAEDAIALSPRRAQPWYLLVNLVLADANMHPAGSTLRQEGYDKARALLNDYVRLVPALAEPRFVLAELVLAEGDRAAARAQAEMGAALYREHLATARRAALFFERIEDLVRAEFFLREVVRLDPTDLVLAYDLAKVVYVNGNAAEALRMVHELQTKKKDILNTDPAFKAAITSYEQSLK